MVSEGTIYVAQQLTTQILNAALENLTSRRHQIDEQIAEVRRILGSSSEGASASAEPATRKRTMSAAGRRAIAQAQRRRWAEKKAASGPAPAAEAVKPKRKLSAAGRRNIVAALKKRWAAKRAAAGKADKTSVKKPPATAKKAAKKTAKKTSPPTVVGGGE
jgi:hypothetical protein